MSQELEEHLTDQMADLIARFGGTARASLATSRGGTGYFAVTPQTPYDGALSIAEQGRQLLAKSAARLTEIGSGKDRLLFVATLVTDIDELASFNGVWDEWIAGHPPPARACFEVSRLGNPNLKIEQIVICDTTPRV